MHATLFINILLDSIIALSEQAFTFGKLCSLISHCYLSNVADSCCTSSQFKIKTELLFDRLVSYNYRNAYEYGLIIFWLPARWRSG